MSGDKAYQWSRRAKFPRQNACNVELIFVGKLIAQHKQANINIAAFEPLVGGGGVSCGARGYSLSAGAKHDLALGGDLIGYAQFVQRFPGTLTCHREVRVLISDGFRRE